MKIFFGIIFVAKKQHRRIKMPKKRIGYNPPPEDFDYENFYIYHTPSPPPPKKDPIEIHIIIEKEK